MGTARELFAPQFLDAICHILGAREVVRVSFRCIGAAMMSIDINTQSKQHTHRHQVFSSVGVFNKHDSLEQSDVENHASLVSFSLEYFRDATVLSYVVFISYLSHCCTFLLPRGVLRGIVGLSTVHAESWHRFDNSGKILLHEARNIASHAISVPRCTECM